MRNHKYNKNEDITKIKEETKLEIGNKVLLKDAAKEKQWSGKLSQKWKGPYYRTPNISHLTHNRTTKKAILVNIYHRNAILLSLDSSH